MSASQIPEGTPVVVILGTHANEPGVVVASTARTVDLLLGRTGERVTVRNSSVDVYA